jgi:hypothetical protein
LVIYLTPQEALFGSEEADEFTESSKEIEAICNKKLDKEANSIRQPLKKLGKI